MRTPIQAFAKQENVTTRFLYEECKAGRLTLTKVGRRTFVDDIDGEAWRALAPKVTGPVPIAIQTAERHIQQLGKMVEAGQILRPKPQGRHKLPKARTAPARAPLAFLSNLKDNSDANTLQSNPRQLPPPRQSISAD
jgi:hypothetical protein